MICQEQHGLHFVQAHGLHIFSWVIDQTVAPLHGINPPLKVNASDPKLPEDQGDLAREVGFTDCYVLASKGFAEKISLSSKAKITSLLDLAQLTISAIVPVRYPGGKRSFTLDVNACGYGKVQGAMRALGVVKCAVAFKFYLGIRGIQERISVQTLVGKRTVKALLFPLGLRMTKAAMQGEDAQLHKPHLKGSVARALCCAPWIPVVAQQAKW